MIDVALDPHKVSSYRAGTVWHMVSTAAGHGSEYTIEVQPDGTLRERNGHHSAIGEGGYYMDTPSIENHLSGSGNYDMILVSGGLKGSTTPTRPLTQEDFPRGAEVRVLRGATRLFGPLPEDHDYDAIRTVSTTQKAHSEPGRVCVGSNFIDIEHLELVGAPVAGGQPRVEAAPEPARYTKEWFDGFIQRALEFAEENSMCEVVEEFLGREDIDHEKLTERTALVTISVEMTYEIDVSGRGNYHEDELQSKVRYEVEQYLEDLDLQDVTDYGEGPVAGVRHESTNVTVEIHKKQQ